jgi:flagellar biosynthesis/type III secretory pathway protein FliH
LDTPQIKEEMMIIADELMQKGMQKGMEQGIQKGREEGLLIGRIQTLEELLGRQASATDVLQPRARRS